MKRKQKVILVSILWMFLSILNSHANDVSVKDFGATGDGKTDDRLAIQAAIDAVSKSGGGTVFFPEGTYLVSAPYRGKDSQAQISAASEVTLEGAGMYRSIVKIADNQGAWAALFGCSRVDKFTMRNLGVDANGSTNKCVPNKPGGNGDNCTHILVRLVNSTNVTIQKCHFYNHSGVWVIICWAGSNLTVDSCIMDRIGGFTVDFDHSTIYTDNDGPVTISNNIFSSKDGPGTLGARTALEIHGSNQKIINNTITGFRYAINVCTGKGSGSTGNQEYIGNRITGVGSCFVFWSMTAAGLDGLLFQDNILEVDVNGWKNMYAGEHRSMFQTSSARGPVKNLVIRHNSLNYKGSEGYGIASNLHAGMWLGAIPGTKSVLPISLLTITDNTISNSTGAGIALVTDVVDAKISGNTIINPGRALSGLNEKYASGIYLEGNMKNVVLDNNTLIDDQKTNTMKTGIWEETSNQGGCIISNNSLKVKGSNKIIPFHLNTAQTGTPWTVTRRNSGK